MGCGYVYASGSQPGVMSRDVFACPDFWGEDGVLLASHGGRQGSPNTLQCPQTASPPQRAAPLQRSAGLPSRNPGLNQESRTRMLQEPDKSCE